MWGCVGRGEGVGGGWEGGGGSFVWGVWFGRLLLRETTLSLVYMLSLFVISYNRHNIVLNIYFR